MAEGVIVSEMCTQCQTVLGSSSGGYLYRLLGESGVNVQKKACLSVQKVLQFEVLNAVGKSVFARLEMERHTGVVSK